MYALFRMSIDRSLPHFHFAETETSFENIFWYARQSLFSPRRKTDEKANKIIKSRSNRLETHGSMSTFRLTPKHFPCRWRRRIRCLGSLGMFGSEVQSSQSLYRVFKLISSKWICEVAFPGGCWEDRTNPPMRNRFLASPQLLLCIQIFPLSRKSIDNFSSPSLCVYDLNSNFVYFELFWARRYLLGYFCIRRYCII